MNNCNSRAEMFLDESATESKNFTAYAARRRSVSHPIKAAILTARRVLHCPFLNSDDPVEEHGQQTHPCPLPNALDTKSNLLFFPSHSINISSARNISRRFHDSLPPIPRPQSEAKILNTLGYATQSGNTPHADVPVRPARPNDVDPDLVHQGPLPVIFSSAKTPKTSNHRRRWTTHRPRRVDLRSLVSEYEPFDVNLASPRRFHSMTTPNNDSDQHDSLGNDAEDQLLVDNIMKAHSPCAFYSFTNDSSDDDDHLSYPKSGNLLTVEKDHEFDMEDLTTPTLKSCEQFESDCNSITPCQTFTTPTHNAIFQELRMTPRMIFEDFQRKFKAEEQLIKSRDLEVLHRKLSKDVLDNQPRPTIPQVPDVIDASAHNNTKNGTTSTAIDSAGDQANFQETSMCSTVSASSGNDCSMLDPSDESFESFGDEQIFGAPLGPESLYITRKSHSPLIDRFPSPPVWGSPRNSTQRTPSPKITPEERPKMPTEAKHFSRVLIRGDRNEETKLSPLILGSLLPSSRESNHLKTPPALHSPIVTNRASADFQRQPSPYRHVQSEGNDHHGPDHLESSTRMMKMFETYLENGPTMNPSSRASFSAISIRKPKLQEKSPLRRMTADFRFPETPKHTMQSMNRSDAKSVTSGGLAVLDLPMSSKGSPRRSSGLCFETMFNKHSERALVKSVQPLIPKHTAPLLPDVTRTKEQSPDSGAVSSDRYASPMSDSDDGPSQSPRTPFGDSYNPPNQVDIERYARELVPDESFIQKISCVKDGTVRLNFQSFSLDVLNQRNSIDSLSRLDPCYNPSKEITSPLDGSALARPHLRHMPSINQISNLAEKLIVSSPTDSQNNPDGLSGDWNEPSIVNKSTGFNTLSRKSKWASIIQDNLKPIPGRNLFEELNNVENLGRHPANNHLSAGVKTSKINHIHRSRSQDLSFSFNEREELTSRPRTGLAQESPSDSFRMALEARQTSTLGAPMNKYTNEYVETILSPIRLYGKQQGILETGNWKTNNLNFRSMKSQYQSKRNETANSGSVSSGKIENNENNSSVSHVVRSRSTTEGASQRNKKKINSTKVDSLNLEDDEREKEESLIVYQIQQEDDNQIINFEVNRLKKIFHNKALKLSKSRSKLLPSAKQQPAIKSILN